MARKPTTPETAALLREKTRLFWQKVPQEERKAHARMMGKAKAAKMTKEQRTAHARMMAKARKPRPIVR
jgi:hypothetical protein